MSRPLNAPAEETLGFWANVEGLRAWPFAGLVSTHSENHLLSQSDSSGVGLDSA